MNIDSVVAMMVFILFVIWAFAFYSQLFFVETENLDGALEGITERILDNLSVTVHVVPVLVNISNVTVSNAVLYTDYIWPFGKNTTTVSYRGVSQSCNITGSTLYWQSDLEALMNEMFFTYSDQDTSLVCTGGFTVVNETQVIPLAAQVEEQIARTQLNGMNATNYSVFKNQLGISRDFNITIENTTHTLLSYGLQPPRVTTVLAKQLFRNMEDTKENITIRILTW